ncbi:MAG: exodeoxyribonuclease V subunit alpha [Kofleriaceae bacterium]
MTIPLHPRGTLRTRFEPVLGGELFRKLGVGARSCDLGDEGLYLAEELVAADVGWLGSSDHPEALAVLVLALMIAQRQGSTCLPLAPRQGPLRSLIADIARVSGLELEPARVAKTIAHLTGTPRFNSVIGANEARLPLVVEHDELYTERSRWFEDRVATRLALRLAAPRSDASAIVAELAQRPGLRPLSDEQARAVSLALGGALAIVTGGPGTGKTVVAAAIVRGLARRGVTNIALAAQTGKAANRLTQVIGEQLAAIADPSDHDRALIAAPPIAQTLHRLLGYQGHRYAHHAQSPLPVGAVIIDEASMVDLELMDAVLDALPLEAPLILIGDARQLPAVDAGQILADLANAQHAASVVRLEHSFRMDTGDPAGRAIFELARAVNDGQSPKLPTARTPGTLAFTGAEWIDTRATPDPHDTATAATEALWHHFGGATALRAADRVFRFVEGRVDPSQHVELEALWSQLQTARILTVTRALPTGAVALNAHLHDLALDRMSVTGRPELVPGEPVMITANDYQRGVFNGDQGMIVRADEGLGRHHFRAVFRIAGELRPFAIEALRDRLELSWALTVHKSQGSELDAIALVLPHEEIPLLTRELVYTAITRARRSAVIVGTRAVFQAGVKRASLRHSGLGWRLGAKLAR